MATSEVFSSIHSDRSSLSEERSQRRQDGLSREEQRYKFQDFTQTLPKGGVFFDRVLTEAQLELHPGLTDRNIYVQCVTPLRFPILPLSILSNFAFTISLASLFSNILTITISSSAATSKTLCRISSSISSPPNVVLAAARKLFSTSTTVLSLLSSISSRMLSFANLSIALAKTARFLFY